MRFAECVERAEARRAAGWADRALESVPRTEARGTRNPPKSALASVRLDSVTSAGTKNPASESPSSFPAIAEVVGNVLASHDAVMPSSIEDVYAADTEARHRAEEACATFAR